MENLKFLDEREKELEAPLHFEKGVILASASPRRRELISLVCDNFTVITSDADETVDESTDVYETPVLLAERKAMAVSVKNEGETVIGCDTVVILNGKILGKPKTESDAVRMLGLLSGNTHTVVSGVCITDGTKTEKIKVLTEVTFRRLSDAEISDYVKTGEPMDKAGAYGIQGKAGEFVTELVGGCYNVIGFPLPEIREILKNFL